MNADETVTNRIHSNPSPLAITMWDFSWLERRWPGGGYEDWGRALDELAERGYNAVRIDAYPHLISSGAEAEYELLPVWSVNDWGAPMRCRIRVMPALTEFIAACGERGIKVGLSTWCRRDTSEAWRLLCTPEQHAEAWLRTLALIGEADLLKHLLYLDFCNEWPMRVWAPFLYGRDGRAVAAPGGGDFQWSDGPSIQWMRASCERVRAEYPELPLTYSIHPWGGELVQMDFLDFYEPHLWMAPGDFYDRVNWTFQHKFDNSEYELVQLHAERLYRSAPEHWQGILRSIIDDAATDARTTGKPLMTTECWGIVDYKDGPMLDWGWVKELCELGVRHATETGAWAAVATSNFCGPQFVGMWRDVDWHRRLTEVIRSSSVSVPVPTPLAKRLNP